jgi:tetratricopeptide (TPR) repeat protein
MAVGIQQFAVATLPRFLRIMVGMFGVGGSKERGLALLRTSADHGVVTSVESRTALSLFLRHDGRYPEALQVQRSLTQQYPHNFLFALEVANLLKDEGHGYEAIAAYKQVLADAQRPGYFIDPRLQLALFGLAETQRGYNQLQDAVTSYTQAAEQPNCSDWLRRRAQVNAGQVYDMLHQRENAVKMYQLAAAGSDSSQADLARKYLKTPYVGK